MKKIIECLESINTNLNLVFINDKKVLNLSEACSYTGFFASTMYKLVASGNIPHAKPTGGKLFFRKDELDKWLMTDLHESSIRNILIADKMLDLKRKSA